MNIDKVNDYNRLHAQTASLVITVSSDENLRASNHSDLANLLWLVHNQLERMKQTFNEVIESANDDQGGEA
jgi:hypothetical protein